MRINFASQAGVVAAVMTMAMTSTADAAGTFHGFEMAIVTTNGHVQNINPDGKIVQVGPLLDTNGSTAGVRVVALPNGGFKELFRGSDRDLWIGDNGGFKHFSKEEVPDFIMGPNSTPAAAVDANGNMEVAFAEGGTVTEVPFANGPIEDIELGRIRDNTSPAMAVLPGSPRGFITTWVDPDGHLNWDNGSGDHVVTNFVVHILSSPAIASSGTHWKIDVEDSQFHLWELTDASPTPVQTGFTMFGTPSLTTLSNGAFALAFDDTNGNLVVQGQNTGKKIEQGNFPAIAADGSGGWKVIYETQQGQNPHTLDSSGRTGIIAQLMDGNISPGAIGLFSR
jgi:hypothetical protein